MLRLSKRRDSLFNGKTVFSMEYFICELMTFGYAYLLTVYHIHPYICYWFNFEPLAPSYYNLSMIYFDIEKYNKPFFTSLPQYKTHISNTPFKIGNKKSLYYRL